MRTTQPVTDDSLAVTALEQAIGALLDRRTQGEIAASLHLRSHGSISKRQAAVLAGLDHWLDCLSARDLVRLIAAYPAIAQAVAAIPQPPADLPPLAIAVRDWVALGGEVVTCCAPFACAVPPAAHPLLLDLADRSADALAVVRHSLADTTR